MVFFPSLAFQAVLFTTQSTDWFLYIQFFFFFFQFYSFGYASSKLLPLCHLSYSSFKWHFECHFFQEALLFPKQKSTLLSFEPAKHFTNISFSVYKTFYCVSVFSTRKLSDLLGQRPDMICCFCLVSHPERALNKCTE